MKKIKAVALYVLAKIKSVWQWLDDNGYNDHYDLGIADEIFSFYAVITLYVSFVDWIQSFPDIIVTIIISIMVDIAFIIISVNQKRFWFRTMFYALAILSSMIGTELILAVSAHDLYPHLEEINAIKLGMLAWMGIREIATFGLNIIKKSTGNGEKMTPSYKLKEERLPSESASLRQVREPKKQKTERKPAEKKVPPPIVKGKVPDPSSGIQNKALSIRQPYAEMILRGIKKIEYRSMPTNIRGRVYIYASLTPGEEEDFESLKASPGDFPTGVLVGTVEIVGCEKPLFEQDYHWLLARPERLEHPITADNRAQPSWFIPFKK